MAKPPENEILHTPGACQSAEAVATREFLNRVADKWSILLIVVLSSRPGHRARFSELQRSIDRISQRMPTTTLRNLERDGMLTREIFPEIPPRVEYELTPLGISLLEPMQGLVTWVGTNWPQVQKSRLVFDEKSKP